jgi:hypothetical protein
VRKFRTGPVQPSLPIDVLVHHFSAVFNRVTDPVPVVFQENFSSTVDEFLDSPFSLDELDAVFRSLDRSSAPGVSGVGYDVLQDLFRLPDGPVFFQNLFSACFMSGSLPTSWRCTEIFLLYKGKGLITDPN